MVPKRPCRWRTTSPPCVALREIAAGNVTAEMLREPEPRSGAGDARRPTTQSTLPRPAVRPRRLTGQSSAMDYASSLLGLLPGGRRTPGLKELLASVGSYLSRRAGQPHPRGRRVRRLRASRARSASPVSRTSRTRWRPPPSSPTCTWMPTPSSRPSCTTSSRTPRRRRTSSRRASAPMSPSSSTGSPSSTRSSSRAARKRRRSPSARCCSRWCATCASSS